jgi:hypothetical protein
MKTLQDLFQGVAAARRSLASYFGQAFGGKRDYYEVLGYEKILDANHYIERFKRDGLAARLVKAFPDETWRLPPKVYEDDTENDTPFEETWNDLERKLRVFHYLHRADILACRNRFSLLYLGFDDAKTINALSQPVSKRGQRSLNYLAVYGEPHIKVAEFDEAIDSPRFGMPLRYEIDIDRGNVERGGIGPKTRIGKRLVHWQRVIHVADGLLEDDLYGTPKLEPVFNYLADLTKVVGGGSEMFWRSARKDLIIEANPDAVITNTEALQQDVEDYVHGLNRFLGLSGATAKTLPAEIASPRDHFDVIVETICSYYQIPQRILLGSERGNQASDQDATKWAESCATRQINANEVWLRTFVDRLIDVGVLPIPQSGLDGYTIEWQALLTEDENAKADRLVKRTQAMVAYANSVVPEILMPVEEYRQDEMGIDAESAFDLPDVEDALAAQVTEDSIDQPIEEDEDEEEDEELSTAA